MSQVTIVETFRDSSGTLFDPTSVVLFDPTATWAVKRDDTGVSIVPVESGVGAIMVHSSTGVYTFTFDEPEGARGIIYTYWVKWEYEGHIDYDEKRVAGEGGDIPPIRQMDKYVAWIKKEFEPLNLIIAQADDSVIEQQVENAIRYWNTHSAFKISGIYAYAAGTKRVQLDPAFKGVVDVIPTNRPGSFLENHPVWTLTGITVLDNVTSDLIMMSEAFRSYRIYVGTNFRFAYQKSDDPLVGGYLYCANVPNGTASLMVIGTKRITKNEDITNNYILNWILYYTKALVKQQEGNVLRKAMIIDTPLDGQTLVTEGREEQKALKESLQKDSRWVIFMRRK